MKKLKLIRLEHSSQGAVGVLLIDGEIHSFTLEPDAADQYKHPVLFGVSLDRQHQVPK